MPTTARRSSMTGGGSTSDLLVRSNSAGRPPMTTRSSSLPLVDSFDEQDDAYRESVLPSAVTNRVAVEAGIKMGWERYLGASGAFIGLDGFGASAPAEELYEHFGITTEAIVAKVKSM